MSSSNDKTRNQPGAVVENPWRRLREFTDARIGLGRAGISLPTSELLAFQLSHAQARDAVHLPLDIDALCSELAADPQLAALGEPIRLHSQATDRMTYLQRPDLGRLLDDASREQLVALCCEQPSDLAIVIVDGLSSRAIAQNAVPFLQRFMGLLASELPECSLAPLTIVEQGRVAVGDDVGALLNARAVLLLIGERPGLSSPDSLGLYLTWAPKPGLTDAARNCISNVRPAGLPHVEGAKRALYLLREAQRLKLSGVNLKDRTEDAVIEHRGSGRNFLVSE
ncbi:MAG: ethanolamine ammonia-lyase subunit EutC [Pseudomonadales bacterium]|jgi:ethanolamine ammonia-lyase small subunit|uniref:Ethanolamine ammonia-lyase small subunit n=1 Tax=Halopseudomonas aestusnigri TaxID=857252 RepID=A0AAQ1G5A5_9GAMM|nr:ethanolamine ammonia-lyase subunit EutC [Halopseudomonas aestusnigri]MAK72880.1 ethanolamine ammonia-lyase subunit EutC [Pseudomonadales bacterium]HBT58700.1 ethanolamine ammonia-lyase subunit EutC [Pseudomonas sp.]MAP75849.1 ethanolamine ammonia-lyase subunit EutC [Pseudomonadales bacterium]MBP74810.1 ethanolamine ammonia-lyase subunit EutC [Pseudomonadales bacterium]MCC4262299.1 ethanolamine ammonia-lyase subunit EutC [Halopseudomonas aestusnigri]|tara:strand:- start:8404 stop:9249 length:846 start_codon:yes stop_codon:yes gene_type:complete